MINKPVPAKLQIESDAIAHKMKKTGDVRAFLPHTSSIFLYFIIL